MTVLALVPCELPKALAKAKGDFAAGRDAVGAMGRRTDPPCPCRRWRIDPSRSAAGGALDGAAGRCRSAAEQCGTWAARAVISPASRCTGQPRGHPNATCRRSALNAYSQRLLDLLELDSPKHNGGLQPRRLELDSRAAGLWRAFTDATERQLGPGGMLEPVRGFANKLAEHAARLAGVIQLAETPLAGGIGSEAMEARDSACAPSMPARRCACSIRARSRPKSRKPSCC